MLCSCQIISDLLVVNNCWSEAHKAVDFVVGGGVVVVVNVDVVALLVVTDHIIFSCGQ